MVQISPECNMTEDRRVSRPLRKNYKYILLSVLYEYELFLMFYSVGMENYIFQINS